MNPRTDNKESSAESYQLEAHFTNLREKLLQDQYVNRLDKRLAYWVLTSDRRLPLVFLDRTIRELLATPFERLLATPGVGQKKIAALLTLLTRATKDTPPQDPFGLETECLGSKRPDVKSSPESCSPFNPAIVSEILWTQWRKTVKRHGLGQEKLGRLAPTLQALPTVIWHTPLDEYMDLSLAEIRSLKTHGEKRVLAVLEIFCVVHEALARSSQQDHLDVDLRPKFVRPVERWITQRIVDIDAPTQFDIHTSLLVPLLEQLKIDAGETVWQLVASRLGITSESRSVRQQAQKMGVTRARVYQLLEECGNVMQVRWPDGDHLLRSLVEKLQDSPETQVTQMLPTIRGLFYPKHETNLMAGVSEHLEEQLPAVVSPTLAKAAEPV